MPVGQKLKALRTLRNISVREVELESRRIAEAKGDKRFRISNGWLAQLEKGISEASVRKLISLSVIYHVKLLDLIRLYDVDIDEIEKYGPVANPYVSQLLSAEIPDKSASVRLPQMLVPSLAARGTGLIPEKMRMVQLSLADDGAAPTADGYLGLDDLTMYPMIWPGSFIWLDVAQNKLQPVAWHDEHERRPIYFIELRDGYACGWCELEGDQLLIIPHHLSPATIRRFTYPKAAEIVGRVIGFQTRCFDKGLDERKPSKRAKQFKTKTIGG